MTAREIVAELVQRYSHQADAIQRSASPYSEFQVRTDFIDPLLTAFGWDLTNRAGLPYSRREVVVEPIVDNPEAEATRGRPDYTLRPEGHQRMFVEAKRPSIDIERDPGPARQVRKYGWTAGLAVSVLTNFRHLAFYDTRTQPRGGESAAVGRIPGRLFRWDEYVERFDELWGLLSREVIGSPRFFETFDIQAEYRGAESFDNRFLEQMRGWRLRLATAVAQSNPTMSARDVGRRTQQILNSLLFLRVCEDRHAPRPLGGLPEYRIAGLHVR